jgi:hypothetical protein
MTEEPENSQFPQPAGENPPEEVTSPGHAPAPEEQLPSFDSSTGSAAQDLPAAEAPEKSVTGNLFSRVTASLKRVSGSLRPLPAGEQETRHANAAEQPPEQAGSTGRLPKPRADESYIADIRQDLQTGETGALQEEGSRNIFKRFTRSLRRATKSLQPQEPAQETPSLADESLPGAGSSQTDIEDEFLAGRLGGTDTDSPAVFEMGPGETLADDAAAWEDYSAYDEAEDQLDEIGMAMLSSGEVPPALLESGDESDGADWMSSIRQETVEDETGALPVDDSPASPAEPGKKEGTGTLRSFLSGLLGGQHGKRQRASENDVPDDIVTNRLGRSLGTQELPVVEAPEVEAEADLLAPAGFDGAEQPDGEMPLPYQARLGDEQLEIEDISFEGYQIAEEDVFSDDLEARFGQVMADAEAVDVDARAGVEPLELSEEDLYQLTPEDETLLWGTPAAGLAEEDQPAAAEEEDLTGGEEPAKEAETGYPGVFRPMSQEAYAASFLTGEEIVYDDTPEDTLMRTAMEKSQRASEDVSIQDMRSIALEGYRDYTPPPRVQPADTGDSPVGPVEAAAPVLEVEPEYYEEEEPLPEVVDNSLKAQLARSTTLQKIFLLEVVAVLVALVFAVPFFLNAMAAGPRAEKTPVIAPRALPADVPFPTGVTLPGGWYFKLEKSTFADGKWKPVKSEWLEGTELRRVIALPWSPQTEAVVQTFQKGDQVNLYLSNKDAIRYEVTSIERVLVGNVDILTDSKPSLVIILFKENSDERWVVICRP